MNQVGECLKCGQDLPMKPCKGCGQELPPQSSALVALVKERDSLREEVKELRSLKVSSLTPGSTKKKSLLLSVIPDLKETLSMKLLTDREEIARIFGRDPVLNCAFYATGRDHSWIRVIGLEFKKETDRKLVIVKFTIGGSPDLLPSKDKSGSLWRVVDFDEKVGLRAYPVLGTGNRSYVELFSENEVVVFPDEIFLVFKSLYP